MARTVAPRRARGLVLLLALGVFALTACLPLTPEEQSLFDRTNSLRMQAGVPVLTQHDVLVTRARALAQELARRGALAHSDLHQVGVSWQAAAENVGRGQEVGQVVDLLAASPSHRRNMVHGAFNFQGVGTARGADGQIYVVQLFCRC